MTRTAAIDPGNRGAIALLDGTRLVKCFSLPTVLDQAVAGGKVRTEPDIDELDVLLKAVKLFRPDHVFIEMQWAQPQDSAMTAFALGGWYKTLKTALHYSGLDYQPVAPTAWKRWKPYQPYGLWGAADDGKAIAIDMCKQYWPNQWQEHLCPLRKGSTTRRNGPHDGRADAALIALYGACAIAGLDVPVVQREEKQLIEAGYF